MRKSLPYEVINQRDGPSERLPGDAGPEGACSRIRRDDDDRPLDASRVYCAFRVGLQLGGEVRGYHRDAVNLSGVQLVLGVVVRQHANVVCVVLRKIRQQSLHDLCARRPGILVHNGDREMPQVGHRVQDSAEVESGERAQHGQRDDDRNGPEPHRPRRFRVGQAGGGWTMVGRAAASPSVASGAA